MDTIDRDKIPHLYNEIFNTNASGIAVLDDLWARYADTPAKQPLDALSLAYQAGQRDVIRYIQLQRDRVSREVEQQINEGQQ
jgi:hypothetical protein